MQFRIPLVLRNLGKIRDVLSLGRGRLAPARIANLSRHFNPRRLLISEYSVAVRTLQILSVLNVDIYNKCLMADAAPYIPPSLFNRIVDTIPSFCAELALEHFLVMGVLGVNNLL